MGKSRTQRWRERELSTAQQAPRRRWQMKLPKRAWSAPTHQIDKVREEVRELRRIGRGAEPSNGTLVRRWSRRTAPINTGSKQPSALRICSQGCKGGCEPWVMLEKAQDEQEELVRCYGRHGAPADFFRSGALQRRGAAGLLAPEARSARSRCPTARPTRSALDEIWPSQQKVVVDVTSMQILVGALLGALLPQPAIVRSGAPCRASRASVGMSAAAEKLRFLTESQVRDIAASHGTPVYVYDEAGLKRQAEAALAFPNAYGLTVRFAMKALPNAAVLQTFDRLGLHIDASSGYEVRRAVAAGVAAEKISLSSQECPDDLDELLALGIKFNACSLRQLTRYGELRPGARGEQLGVRFNPGLGSGGTGKTNVGGPSSSFGIWHEAMPEVQEILSKFDLEPARVHTHIGSGSDPAVWQRVSGLSLDLCEKIPSVSVLNLGGGYKVGRMATEGSTDLAVVGVPVKEAFEAFSARKP